MEKIIDPLNHKSSGFWSLRIINFENKTDFENFL